MKSHHLYSGTEGCTIMYFRRKKRNLLTVPLVSRNIPNFSTSLLRRTAVTRTSAKSVVQLQPDRPNNHTLHFSICTQRRTHHELTTTDEPILRSVQVQSAHRLMKLTEVKIVQAGVPSRTGSQGVSLQLLLMDSQLQPAVLQLLNPVCVV